MARYKDPRYFLLETTPAAKDKIITGCRLPTRRQVLLCFIAHKEELRKNDTTNSKKVLRDAANATTTLVLPFYEKARIPSLLPNKISQEILKYYDEFKKLLKINVCERKTPGKQLEKIMTFKNQMHETMKLWPRDALSRIKNEEDRAFLMSMQSDRKATMSGVDKNLAEMEQRREKRELEEENRRKRESNESQDRFATVSADSHSTEESDEDEDENHDIEIAKPSHKRCKKTGDQIHIPFDILKSERLVSTAVRNNITPTALAATVHSLVEACKGDPSRLNLNPSQSYR